MTEEGKRRGSVPLCFLVPIAPVGHIRGAHGMRTRLSEVAPALSQLT